jgi:hypothetical protein
LAETPPKKGRISSVLAEIPPKKGRILLFWAKFSHFVGILTIFMGEYSTLRIRPKWPKFLITVYTVIPVLPIPTEFQPNPAQLEFT